MEELLIDTLTYFNLPVIQQGSMGENEQYPGQFFTFWNNGSTDSSHYDNAAATTIWDFNVNFYSNDPESLGTIFNQAIDELKKVGFIVSGKGYDVPSDEPSHTGKGINVLYMQLNQ